MVCQASSDWKGSICAFPCVSVPLRDSSVARLRSTGSGTLHLLIGTYFRTTFCSKNARVELMIPCHLFHGGLVDQDGHYLLSAQL